MADAHDTEAYNDGSVDFYLENWQGAEGQAQYDAWLEGYGDPFDFTGSSYLAEYAQPLRERTALMDDFDGRVEAAQAMLAAHGNWPIFDGDNLRKIAEIDEAIHLDGGHFLRADLSVLDDEETIKLCAAGRQLGAITTCGDSVLRASLGFWGRLHALGATPELVREANHLLHLRGGDDEWLDEFSDLTETQSRRACLQYHSAVQFGDDIDHALKSDLEGGCIGGLFQLETGLGALAERKKRLRPGTNLLRGLVSRDSALAKRTIDELNAHSEARARKSKFGTYTAFELVLTTTPTTKALQIRTVERAVAQHTSATPAVSRRPTDCNQRPCARNRASRGASSRFHGSRRDTGSGTSSSDDPDPESLARRGTYGLESRRIQCVANPARVSRWTCKCPCLWDIALVLAIGNGLGNAFGVVNADFASAWAPLIAVLLSPRRPRN